MGFPYSGDHCPMNLQYASGKFLTSMLGLEKRRRGASEGQEYQC